MFNILLKNTFKNMLEDFENKNTIEKFKKTFIDPNINKLYKSVYWYIVFFILFNILKFLLVVIIFILVVYRK